MKFVSMILVILFCFGAFSNIYAAASNFAADPGNEPIETVIAGINDRADGLVYVSESDASVHGVLFERSADVLDVATFREAANLPPLMPIEEFDYETFFASSVNRDTSGRWEDLKTYIDARLKPTVVFKTGTVQRDIYAVGLYSGRIIGIKTSSVET